MAVKKYKPVTPGQRGMTGYSFEEITKSEPERSLVMALRKKGGRNVYGRVTVRHQAAGASAICAWSISSATNWAFLPKSLRLSMTQTGRLDWRCCITPMAKSATSLPRLAEGWRCVALWCGGRNTPGNCLPISGIPVGTMVHNIEVKEGKGGQLVRSAGTAAQLLAKEGDYARFVCLRAKYA